MRFLAPLAVLVLSLLLFPNLAFADTWYLDADGDGFGDPNTSVVDVSPPPGYVADNTDCDDSDPQIHPGAPDVCDGVDNDCDGQVDEDAPTWYADSDGDGYGAPGSAVTSCAQPPGHVANSLDCDDTNASVHPGAPEICDGIDNNCDGITDPTTFYADTDGDGYGDPNNSMNDPSCSPPAGYVVDNTDCDDSNFQVHPGAQELCDGLDNDCDGTIDDNAADAQIWYSDFDGDGYGDPGTGIQSCSPPPGYVLDGSDCDDQNPQVNPGALEMCDGLDNDCNGVVDDACFAYRITSITDVGNDQGRRVRIRWTPYFDDYPGGPATITGYSIYRRVQQGLKPGVRGDSSPLATPPGDWDFLLTVPATGDNDYSTVVTTLCDSTDQGICWSSFFVRAHTPNPQLNFDTVPDSGYSVDNLVPTAPQNLAFAAPGFLSWDEAPEEDFNYFTVYGSPDDMFDAGDAVIGSTTGLSFDVQTAKFAYYHVTTTDMSGNEGPPSTALNTTAVPDPSVTPTVAALLQSRPNPFRGSTFIAFDVPAEDRARLTVYDVSGRTVAVLVDGTLPAGRYTLAWLGRDDRGNPVKAGVYFYSFRTSTFTATRKMVLMR